MSSVVILIQITEDRKKGIIKTRGYIDARDMNIQDQYQTTIMIKNKTPRLFAGDSVIERRRLEMLPHLMSVRTKL